VEKNFDLNWLLRVRVVVARCGEMDAQKWWNTDGQLGPYGARVLKRGLPRTYHFAQARSTSTVAAHRCAEVFAPTDAVTFWRLPDDVEEEFDALWERWLDAAESWAKFFDSVAALKDFDVANVLKGFSLVDEAEVDASARLKVADGAREVLVPGVFEPGRKSIDRAPRAGLRTRRTRRPRCPVRVEEGMRLPRSSRGGACARAPSSRRPIGCLWAGKTRHRSRTTFGAASPASSRPSHGERRSGWRGRRIGGLCKGTQPDGIS
jgi:hypothetical protein